MYGPRLNISSRPSGDWRRSVLLIGLLLIFFATFFLRLQELTLQNIWWDEARNIDVALRPFAQIATAPELDIHPPVYFWLLHGWLGLAGAHLGQAPAQLAYLGRFFSVWAAMVATALVYLLAGRIAGRSAAFYALLIAAASPFWLAESQETRMYTVGFALLAGAAVALLLEMIGASSTGKGGRHLVLFVMLSTLALLTHYNVAFILVAWYLWWAIWALFQAERWRLLRRLLICGLTMTILTAPITPVALRQIPSYANPNLTVPTLWEYLWQNWQAYLGGYAFDATLLNGYAQPWLWFAMLLFGISLLLYFMCSNTTKVRATPVSAGLVPPTPPHTGGKTALPPALLSAVPRHSLLTFLLVWLFGGLGLYYIAVLDRGAFNVRYSSFVTPALYVLLGVAVARWGVIGRPLALCAALGFLIGIGPALYADLYDARFAREDIASVTDWLRQTASPEDLILVDQKYPFGFYYGKYTISADQTPVGQEAAPARYLFVDINTVDQQLEQWAIAAHTIFWVQWFESDTDPRHAVRFLLDKTGVRAGSKDFQGYKVDWWSFTPPNHFELAPDWRPLHWAFGQAVATLAVSLPLEPLPNGQKIPVVIRWQPGAQSTASPPLKARVALYDAQDVRLVQSDDRLLNDRHRMPAAWSADDQPVNVYLLMPEEPLAMGQYEVRLLVYHAESLEPLPLLDAAGNVTGVEAILGKITVP